MCTEIYFKSEGKIAHSSKDLAEIIGGYDKFVLLPDYELADFVGGSCLCGVDVEATLKPLDYVLSQWEDGLDYTARKPNWLIEQEQQERDRRRYDAAMAEMRAAPQQAA
jgi:hypothetical protein